MTLFIMTVISKNSYRVLFSCIFHEFVILLVILVPFIALKCINTKKEAVAVKIEALVRLLEYN